MKRYSGGPVFLRAVATVELLTVLEPVLQLRDPRIRIVRMGPLGVRHLLLAGRILFATAGYNDRQMSNQATVPPSPEADTGRLFALLLQVGLQPEDAHEFVQNLQRMAAQNVIERFGSELEAQSKVQQAEVVAVQEDVKSIRWLIVALIIGAALLTTIGQFVLTAVGPSQ